MKPKKFYKATKAKPQKYYLNMKFNDAVYETLTDDLEEAIMSFKPKVLKTKIIFRIETDGKMCERQVFVLKGKQIFRNKLFLSTFVRHLIFKNHEQN